MYVCKADVINFGEMEQWSLTRKGETSTLVCMLNVGACVHVHLCEQDYEFQYFCVCFLSSKITSMLFFLCVVVSTCMCLATEMDGRMGGWRGMHTVNTHDATWSSSILEDAKMVLPVQLGIR